MDKDPLKKISRHLEAIEKTQNLQYDDRNILEDILLKIDANNREVGNLREEVKLLKDRVEKSEKNMTADIKDVHNEVQIVKDNVQEVNENITKTD